MKTSIFKSNNICLVILFILIIIVIIQSDRYEIIINKSTSPPRNIFFDLGANVGDSAENFLGLLDKVENVNDIKDVIPENKLKEKWIMYLIEGNSRFDDNLLKIK